MSREREISPVFSLQGPFCVNLRVRLSLIHRLADRCLHSCVASAGFTSIASAEKTIQVHILPLSLEENRCCSISGQYIRVM